jgi:hypothetical protein
MRAGSRSLHFFGATTVDAGSSAGCFFHRLLIELSTHQKDDLASHGVLFTPQRLVRPGWFKVYLTGEELAYLRSQCDVVSLLPVKKHSSPNFAEL